MNPTSKKTLAIGEIGRKVCARNFCDEGQMSERFKEHAWKACVGVTLPWVRIPLCPLLKELSPVLMGLGSFNSGITGPNEVDSKNRASFHSSLVSEAIGIISLLSGVSENAIEWV